MHVAIKNLQHFKPVDGDTLLEKKTWLGNEAMTSKKLLSHRTCTDQLKFEDYLYWSITSQQMNKYMHIQTRDHPPISCTSYPLALKYFNWVKEEL